MSDLDKQLADLKADFETTMVEIETETDKAMLEACILVKAQAVRNAPVDTGLLKSSINYVVEKEGEKVEGIVGTAVEYAPYIEYGASGRTPKPYLEPALTENYNKIASLFERAIAKGLQ
jgi:HK97 gp10 family phage protein